MDFSVLMSVYYKENPERFRIALKSNITDQKLKPSQFVLVCDGPLNKELDDVIDEYIKKYPNIMKVYRLKTNCGLGNALNFGVKQCDYDLIARSDSDDICTPNRFESQVKYMQNNPEVSASSGTIDEFDDDYTKPIRVKKLPFYHKELCRYSRKRNPLNHMATIFRKKDVLDVGSYEHLQYLEDYYLWIKLIANGKKIGNIDELLVHACVGNGMVERRSDKRYIKSWKVLGKFMIKNRLQTRFGYFLSIIKITLWCYMPKKLKLLIYSKILRQRGGIS